MDISKIGKTENSKQVEYMNDIRNVGMGLLFGQVDSSVYQDVFIKYIDYIDNKPSEYLRTIKEISEKIDNNKCSPDDLLFAMCKHTLQIQYQDEYEEYEYEEYRICHEDDDEDEYDEERTGVTVKNDENKYKIGVICGFI